MHNTIDNNNNGSDKDKPNSVADSWKHMADEMLAEKQNDSPEAPEKGYFETEAEFNPETIRDFREMLLNANKEQTKSIIESRIAFLEDSCEKVGRISPDRFDQHIHRGYISGNTEVGFQGGIITMGSHYKLKNTDYLYEAVSALQDNKEKITNGMQLFYGVENFLNSYFGIPDTTDDKRMDIIDQKAGLSNPDLSDDEFFDAIDKIDISIFKGEHVAQCSERTAMAQNILSLFGYETYYMTGAVSIDGKVEDHAFNVVANNSGTKNTIDFSVSSNLSYNGTNWIVPTLGQISDFEAFQKGAKSRTATYEGIIDDNGNIKRRKTHDVEYVVTTK